MIKSLSHLNPNGAIKTSGVQEVGLTLDAYDFSDDTTGKKPDSNMILSSSATFYLYIIIIADPHNSLKL